MYEIKILIDGKPVTVSTNHTILEAAIKANMYIPVLCHHPDLPGPMAIRGSHIVYHGNKSKKNTSPGAPAEPCGLCVVEIKGEQELVRSCETAVRPGMMVITNSERVKASRRERLKAILERHPHSCLVCSHQRNCTQTHCATNVPENERCCELFSKCELQMVADYVGIPDETPRWKGPSFPVIDEDPLFLRDYNLCIGCTRCVRACTILRGVEAIGFVYDKNNKIQVGTLKQSIKDSGCKFCLACVDVCPTGALRDKLLPDPNNKEKTAPCIDSCPVHMDVPWYLRLAGEGKVEAASKVIRENVPFPGVLGHVCTHPCEDVCRRREVDEPIAICAVKRYIANNTKDIQEKTISSKILNPCKIAIIGAGPAGLTAAFYLKEKGYKITVFESMEEAGGMIRYGIPQYRLPKPILEKEVQHILGRGIDFRPNCTLGKDFTLKDLKDSGYDTIFIAIGAHKCKKIPIEGAGARGVFWGIEFLKATNRGFIPNLNNKVVVVGGGDVSIDVAISLIRCGVEDVKIVCLEGLDNMPAHSSRVEEAMREGVRLLTGWAPKKILVCGDVVRGIEFTRCENLVNSTGESAPIFDKEDILTLDADQVVFAIGQSVDLSFIDPETPLKIQNGYILIDPNTLETTIKGVFAGGDVTGPPLSVVHAIADGRKAACSIDRYLGGDGLFENTLYNRDSPNSQLGKDMNFAYWQRQNLPKAAPPVRKNLQKELYLDYTKEQVTKEARRCLQCDLRAFIGSNPSPPKTFSALTPENVAKTPSTEGVFTLYDKEEKVILIRGTPDLKKELAQAVNEYPNACWFDFEEHKMYSSLETELIQQYIQKYGHIPGDEDSDLDDLF